MSETKNAVIYCRVSTKEQVEEGNSLITQEKLCKEYALKHGYTITHSFIELGESAKTADRTELQKLLKLCADKKQGIVAVIAYKIDRISRNTDDYSQIRILLKRYGVEIKSTSELFENTPAGRFMENIIANVAQFDNEVRTERSVGGMKQAVAEGRYVWKAPLGYSNVKINGKSTIAPNADASIVQEAFDYFIQTNSSIYGVQRYISNKYGISLSRSRFYALLKNPVYIGQIDKFGSISEGSFDAIISIQLFNQVQDKLSHKKKRRTYKITNPDFTLRRFIKTIDGKGFTGFWSKGKYKKYAYYRQPDNGKQYAKAELEALFVHYLNSFAIDEKLQVRFTQLIEHYANSIGTRSKQKQTQLLTSKNNLLLKRKELITKNLDGFIDDAILKEQLAICNERINTIDFDLQKQEKPIDVSMILGLNKTLLENPGDYWKTLSPEGKLAFQWFAFPKGIIFDGKIFRTQQIASIFKVKSLFSSVLFGLVNHPTQNIKQLLHKMENPKLANEFVSLLQDINSEILLYSDESKNNILFKTEK